MTDASAYYPPPEITTASVKAVAVYANTPAWTAKMEKWGMGYASLTRDVILQDIRDGAGPIAVARKLRQYSEMLPVSAAENLTRTLQLTAYRDSSVEMEKINGGFLDYKIRISALSPKSCCACIALHGTRLEVGERVDDHYRGYCSESYVLKNGQGIPTMMQADSTPGHRNFVPFQNGEDWFASLSPERQAMQSSFLKSPAKLAAYRSGVPLSEFVGEHLDDVFGNQVIEKSLRGMLGDGAEKFYVGSPPKLPKLFVSEKVEKEKTALDYINQSAEIKLKVLDRREQDIMRWLEKRGITPDVENVQMQADKFLLRVQALIDDNSLSVRASVSGAENIIKDGRFKSQFETKTSNGALSPTYRAQAERLGFGYDIKMDKSMRPIYGYIDTPDNAADSYGEIEFVLKEDMKKMATYSWGDSLGDMADGMVTPCASNKLDLSMVISSDIDFALEKAAPFGYIEAQIHGKVMVENIKRVIIHVRSFELTGGQPYRTALTKMLDEKGILWTTEVTR